MKIFTCDRCELEEYATFYPDGWRLCEQCVQDRVRFHWLLCAITVAIYVRAEENRFGGTNEQEKETWQDGTH